LIEEIVKLRRISSIPFSILFSIPFNISYRKELVALRFLLTWRDKQPWNTFLKTDSHNWKRSIKKLESLFSRRSTVQIWIQRQEFSTLELSSYFTTFHDKQNYCLKICQIFTIILCSLQK